MPAYVDDYQAICGASILHNQRKGNRGGLMTRYITERDKIYLKLQRIASGCSLRAGEDLHPLNDDLIPWMKNQRGHRRVSESVGHSDPDEVTHGQSKKYDK